MVQIRHLSVTTQNPEKAAKALAEMTGGKAQPFSTRTMIGAWVCIWSEQENHLIEFLPDGYLMRPADYGADFHNLEMNQNYNSTHFQLEVTAPLENIKRIADQYGFKHKFRPYRGGPLYDVWFEDQLLIEFTSDEIRELLKDLETNPL